MHKVFIFTLNWNGIDKLKKLYPTLKNSLQNIDFKWFIKDNGSVDSSVEEICNWNDSNINLIKYPNNKQNYAQGMNLLFKESSPQDNDVIITLNNDVVINDEKSLHNMLSLLLNDNDIGMIGAKLTYTNTNKIQHCGVLFHKYNGLPFHYRAGALETERDKINRYYPAVTGAVAMLKADTFANCYNNKSGNKGFKEEYVFAFEDIDMALRINHFLKKKILYCGETEIYHEESASLKKNPIHKMFFNNNCKIFMDNWHNHIDISLTDKYNDPKYNLYTKKVR